MPFKNRGIFAKSVEEFNQCERQLVHLNSLVQTLNNKEIPVKMEPAMLGQGMTITPTFGKIEGIRVKPDAIDDFWIDYEPEKKQLSIRARPELVYVIRLEADP